MIIPLGYRHAIPPDSVCTAGRRSAIRIYKPLTSIRLDPHPRRCLPLSPHHVDSKQKDGCVAIGILIFREGLEAQPQLPPLLQNSRRRSSWNHEITVFQSIRKLGDVMKKSQCASNKPKYPKARSRRSSSSGKMTRSATGWDCVLQITHALDGKRECIEARADSLLAHRKSTGSVGDTAAQAARKMVRRVDRAEIATTRNMTI